MISRIQARNYRCFRDIDVSLDRFHVMVGPNASGKSTLFDIVSFLADMLRDGLPTAIGKRTRNFQDLVWRRPRVDPGFELAVEIKIPETEREFPPTKSAGDDGRVFRYEVAIQERDGEASVMSERGCLLGGPAAGDSRIVFRQDRNGGRTFHPETGPCDREMPQPRAFFGPPGLAASPGNLSWDLYPVTCHALYMLAGFVDRVVLDGATLRRASPLDCDKAFSRDGASLPWNVLYLQEKQQDDYREWIQHVQTALPELQDIRVVEREDERSAYLMLRYEDGVEVPSWMASEGTLRLLALTLLAYLPVAESYPNNRRSLHGIILIEEPENGVHPLAIDAIYDSLASVYRGQVLATTHSPTFLGLASPKQALSFAMRADGSARVVRGTENPYLEDWKETRDMSLLFAKDVIG